MEPKKKTKYVVQGSKNCSRYEIQFLLHCISKYVNDIQHESLTLKITVTDV